MDFLGIDIVCPACHGNLESRGGGSPEALTCQSCSREYPIIVGIPDLRLWPDPYISIEADRAKGVRLHSECAGLTFAESVRLYYSITEAVPPFQARRFERGLLSAPERSRDSLDAWESFASTGTGDLTLLDAGCGTAPMLVQAAGRYRLVAGVDVALRWLVLARKRLMDHGVRAPLLCACAEAMPFKDGQFDRVVADSAIEHFRGSQKAVNEFHRVMKPGGLVFAATPNRFSLGPDPHAGLPAGGWFPNSVVAAYVRAKGGIPPQRTLFSRSGLRRLLERSGLTVRAIYPPMIPTSVRRTLSAPARTLVSAYNALARLPFARQVVERIGPLLHAVAQKPADESAGRAPGARTGEATAPAPSPSTPLERRLPTQP